MDIFCDNCSGTNISNLWKLGRYIIFECNDCGLVFTVVSEHIVKNAYEIDYYKSIYPDYESDKNIQDINNNLYLDKIESVYEKGSILEIGSAFGFFLLTAEKRGWKAYGFEKSRFASDYAMKNYNLNVINKDFLDFNLNRDFNVVCLFDTIEHLVSPSKYIKKISSILNYGDGLIITTGDLSSPFSKLFGKKWRMFAPPYHIFYYSESSISYLLNKYGFKILSITHEGKYQNLNSIFNAMFGIKKYPFFKIPIKVNFGDIMLIIAKKNI